MPVTFPASNQALYTQNAYNTVVNTVTESSAIGTSKGTGLIPDRIMPANYFTANKQLELMLKGTYQTPTVPGSVVVKIKLGTVVIAQVTVAASILATGSTTRELFGEATITCYTSGSTGTFVCDGFLGFEIAAGVTMVPFSTAATIGTATSTVTVNTTTSLLLDVTQTWSNAQAGQGTTIGNGTLTAVN